MEFLGFFKPIFVVFSLYRNQTGDNPLIVFYALVGNDVCNG